MESNTITEATAETHKLEGFTISENTGQLKVVRISKEQIHTDLA